MRHLLAGLIFLFALFVSGCGGGGGGGGTGGSTVVATGIVRWLPTGGAPAPSATVQVGDRTAATSTDDGSFSLNVPVGSNSVLVLYQPVGAAPVSFRFDVPTITENTDLGDFWIGPEKVAVIGRVRSATDDSPLAGARVEFAGRTAVTDGSGNFGLADVAYDSSSLASFFALEGRVSLTGFFTGTFSPASTANAGVVTIDDVFLSSDASDLPPGAPATIEGLVSPSDQAAGTLVELWQGGVPIRQVTVGSDRRFGFWVPVGQYVVRARNPVSAWAAPDASVNVTDTSTTVRKDVLLVP